MISKPLRIRVWGPWACFTRPEFHVERVSYPVITPSAARGVLEAILMKPIEKPEADRRERKIGFRWHVLRIGIVRKGILTSILRNELGYEKHNFKGFDVLEERTQRHSLILKGVENVEGQNRLEYLIEAAIEVPGPVKRIGDEFLVAKYQGMFERRARFGQCHHRPYLGCREFPCNFEWAPEAEPPAGSEDFGTVFRDFDFDTMWEHWKAGSARPTEWPREFGPRPLQPLHAKSDANGWITVTRVISENGLRKAVPA